jgi:hypothetical protein
LEVQRSMVAYFEQRISYAAGWARGIAAFSVVLFLMAALSHRFELLETNACLEVLALVAALAVLALVLAAMALPRVWYRGDLGGRDLVWAVIIAFGVLTPYLVTAYRAYTFPALNDISTDTADPPQLLMAMTMRGIDVNTIRPMEPDKIRFQAENYPEVVGRRYELPSERVLEVVIALLDRRGWKVYPGPRTLVGGEVTVEAVAKTLLFGFLNDVAIRLTDEGNSTYVDMRSASRYGTHDMGDNAARITAFLKELDSDIAAQAGTVAADPVE